MEILDGAIGTELARRGASLEGRGWSARAITEAPDILGAIHADYAAAGATLHTANTFRTQPDVDPAWEARLHQAVAIAKASVPDTHRVVGSLAPVEDCYQPDRSPGARAYEAHRTMARALVEAGAEVVLCETFAHPDEAIAAVEAASIAGVPVWLALTAGPDGDLLSPDDFARVGARAIDAGASRLLVNCVAATRTLPFVEALAATGADVGVYANAGDAAERIGWDTDTPEGAARYAELARAWADAGATVIGGCCGTGPLHIATLTARFGSGVGGALLT